MSWGFLHDIVTYRFMGCIHWIYVAALFEKLRFDPTCRTIVAMLKCLQYYLRATQCGMTDCEIE